MTDYSCSFHHPGHARVPGTITGCFIGQLFIQSPRPDRDPLDHKVLQRNGVNAPSQSGRNGHSVSLELLGESSNKP